MDGESEAKISFKHYQNNGPNKINNVDFDASIK